MSEVTGYYHRFIKDYANDGVALIEATKKVALDQVEWLQALQEEFEYL